MTDATAGAADGRGWALKVVVCATILLALFNANSARTWLALQPPDGPAARVQPVVDGWWRATSAVGLDAPRAGLSAAWAWIKAASWPGAAGAASQTLASGETPDR